MDTISEARALGAVAFRGIAQLPREVAAEQFVRWGIAGETERGVCYFEHCRHYFEMIEERVVVGTNFKVRFFALAGMTDEVEAEVDRRYPLYWVEHPIENVEALPPQDFSESCIGYWWCECDFDNDQLGAATLESL